MVLHRWRFALMNKPQVELTLGDIVTIHIEYIIFNSFIALDQLGLSCLLTRVYYTLQFTLFTFSLIHHYSNYILLSLHRPNSTINTLTMHFLFQTTLRQPPQVHHCVSLCTSNLCCVSLGGVCMCTLLHVALYYLSSQERQPLGPWPYGCRIPSYWTPCKYSEQANSPFLYHI